MSEFWYQGRSSTGKIEGIVKATNATTAKTQMRDNGVSVFRLKRLHPFAQASFWDFLEMLGLFLRQGYNLTEALNLMAEDEHRRIKKIAPVLLARLESGLSLADCLKMSFRKLRPEWLTVLRIGEDTARLDETCSLLFNRRVEQTRQRRRLLSTIAYPLIVIFATIIVAWVLFDSILPELADTLQDTAEMPIVSQYVLSMSGQFGTGLERGVWGLVLVLIPLVLARRIPPIRPVIDRGLATLPGLRHLIRAKTRWQYFESLSLGLSGGLPLQGCLELAMTGIDNIYFRDACGTAHRRIFEGEPISKAINHTGLIRPREFLQLNAAENTGQLEPVIANICADMKERQQMTNTALAQLAGPLFILIVGCLIFIVALAIVTPMMAMQAQLGDLAQ